MTYNFDKFVDRNGTHTCRWRRYEPAASEKPYGEDYIYMSTADMDLQCSEGIRNELQKVLDHNIYGYTMLTHNDDGEYFDLVADWFKKRRNWDLKRENIYYVPGSMQGVRKALEAFTKPGEGCIINRPVYGPFTQVVEGSGRRAVNCPLVRDDSFRYTLNFDELERLASDPNNTAYLLCSPHNPVGRVWTEEELRTIIDICHRNHVLIIADEVHCDFVWGGRPFYSISQLAGGKGVITCTGFGKTFNLAALNPAHVIVTDEELLPTFQQQMSYMMTNPFTVAAVRGACLHSDDWLEQLHAYLEGNLDAAMAFLQERLPKVHCRRPEGGYMLWMDSRDYGLPEEEIHHRIYHNAQVVLEDGVSFCPETGQGFQRACIPMPRARLMEALERIAKEFA